ncbi:MAG: cytochrome P450 [Acidimicrobiales bacterium]
MSPAALGGDPGDPPGEPPDLGPAAFAAGVPHDDLRRLRRAAPVWWSDQLGCWVVTSHRLVERCNRDVAAFSSSDGVVDPDDPGAPKWAPLTALDPPEHSRQRRLVMAPFTPGAVARLEGTVRRIAGEAAAELRRAGGGDFVATVAAAVPFRVMAALTGTPVEDEALVVSWTNAVMPSEDPEYRPDDQAAPAARRALGDYCLELARAQRRGRRSPLAEVLFEARLDGRPLSDAHVANFLDTFLVGGTETTRHLLAHGLLAMFEHPGACRVVATGSAPVAGAVEEMLRWASPVLQHSRRATSDIELAGAHIGAGDRVTLWIVSANRDEAVFDEPERFDPARTPNPHVALGAGGPHHCLGAHLARLEARVVFETLAPLLESLVPDGPAVRAASNFFHGLKRLPVAFRR